MFLIFQHGKFLTLKLALYELSFILSVWMSAYIIPTGSLKYNKTSFLKQSEYGLMATVNSATLQQFT